VTVLAPDAEVRGTVVSARCEGGGAPVETAETPEVADADAPPAPVRAPTTDGGMGRLTVAVNRTDAAPLLRASSVKVVVEPRGTRREYELISLLRRAGNRFRRLTVDGDGALAGTTLREASVRDTYGVAIVAIRKQGGWRLAPRGDTDLAAGEELYAVGPTEQLDAFAEAVA
jgi:hypothetical protein